MVVAKVEVAVIPKVPAAETLPPEVTVNWLLLPTVKAWEGEEVPMPTLPEEVTRNRSVLLLCTSIRLPVKLDVALSPK